ncbi:hypothetical protein ACFL1B_06245 [Nanoarchaeota archaeon]
MAWGDVDLEDRLSARQIVNKLGMSARPEAFSGRGATTTDLNYTRLERIYEIVEREHGEEAAEQFVQMVAAIPRLTATDFLNTLYVLEGNNWEWDASLLGDQRGMDFGPDTGDGKREANAYSTVVTVLGGEKRADENGAIRGDFLKRHGVEQPQQRPDYFMTE